jgi:hypothetical protein
MPVDWNDGAGSDRLATAALAVGALSGLMGFIGSFGHGGLFLSWILALAVTVPLAIAGYSRAGSSTARTSALTGAILGLAPLAIFAAVVTACLVSGCD